MAKKKQEILHSISINGDTKRTLLWCDDKWYETGEGNNFIFTKEQVEKIKAQLQKHFILKATIRDVNGNVEQWSAFKKQEEERAAKAELSEFDFTMEI